MGHQLRSNNFTASTGDCPADMVMLWTDQETLFSTCTATRERAELWRSHWTKLHVNVHARAAFVDQLVTHNTLGVPAEAGPLRGRIVFAPRGLIPFTEKAVRAQVERYSCRYPYHSYLMDDTMNE
jgi:hypothetical protein